MLPKADQNVWKYICIMKNFPWRRSNKPHPDCAYYWLSIVPDYECICECVNEWMSAWMDGIDGWNCKQEKANKQASKQTCKHMNKIKWIDEQMSK